MQSDTNHGSRSGREGVALAVREIRNRLAKGFAKKNSQAQSKRRSGPIGVVRKPHCTFGCRLRCEPTSDCAIHHPIAAAAGTPVPRRLTGAVGVPAAPED